MLFPLTYSSVCFPQTWTWTECWMVILHFWSVIFFNLNSLSR
uniref:Uncharacterized protein n=1 Tax=Arundo donax TaxID=35708 RepID=A0A0A9BJI5_ARUDO